MIQLIKKFCSWLIYKIQVDQGILSPPAEEETVVKKIVEDFTDIGRLEELSREELLEIITTRNFQRTIADDKIEMPNGMKAAMDGTIQQSKLLFSVASQNVSDVQLAWYGSQGFIGYQTCAILAQQWLVDKVCTMPARDAVRKGFDITINNGDKIEPEIRDAIRQADVEYRLNHHLVQFVRKGRIFGIRIAMFKMRGASPEYYENPFNLDGVTPGMYQGIVQIDPYWITPILDQASAADPSSLNFYEPTWWQINGKKIHRTHLMIMRTDEVTDILKPTYFYGGIPIPQKIMTRVYAAERTADEAPLLAMTKRLMVFHTDLTQAISKQGDFQKKMEFLAYFRNNYGVNTIGIHDQMEQFDTALTDLDAVIMTQFQLVAAAGNVPATKLLGTSPKGFNTTGEAEETNYHEELESIQAHDLTAFIERHHALLIRSKIAPENGIEPFETSTNWRPLDSVKGVEKATIQKTKADTGLVYIQSGAISPMDERKRIIDDPDSGYNGVEDLNSENEEVEDPDTLSGDPDTVEKEPTSV